MTNDVSPDLDTAIAYFESHTGTPAIGAAAAFMNLATVKATLGFLRELEVLRRENAALKETQEQAILARQQAEHELDAAVERIKDLQSALDSRDKALGFVPIPDEPEVLTECVGARVDSVGQYLILKVPRDVDLTIGACWHIRAANR